MAHSKLYLKHDYFDYFGLLIFSLDNVETVHFWVLFQVYFKAYKHIHVYFIFAH